jgi:hypothetical protein
VAIDPVEVVVIRAAVALVDEVEQPPYLLALRQTSGV